jgi:hypothetical protein
MAYTLLYSRSMKLETTLGSKLNTYVLRVNGEVLMYTSNDEDAFKLQVALEILNLLRSINLN